MHGKYPCIFYFRAMYCDKLFAQTGFIIIKKTGVTKMTEEIYGDVLFLINFSMDFLSLFITGKIMHLKLKAWRVLVAASIGGVYGVAALFFPFDGIPLVFANIACAAVMCFTAFQSRGKISSVFLCCLLFYGVGMLLGGAMTALYSRIGKYTGYISIGGSISTVFGDIPIWAFALAAALAAVITYVCGRLVARKGSEEHVRITFGFLGKSAEADCLVDSGNLLSEPITGTPVICLRKEAVSDVFPCEVVSAMQNGGFGASLDTMRRLRFIPSVSVTGNATVIAAVPDYCYIDTINGKEPKKALIAIDYSDCDFGGTDGIVPKILL